MGYAKQNDGTGETAVSTALLGPVKEPIPAFDRLPTVVSDDLRPAMQEAVRAWLRKTPSIHTRVNYQRDLAQFFAFNGIAPDCVEHLVAVRPEQVAAWRDDMRSRGLSNSSIRRKLTAIRSLFSYLQVYGYVGANPAHSKFVMAPSVPRDGKTVGLSPLDCRRLLDAPDPDTPMGVRDRAIIGVLAYSACRVGELVALRVRDFVTSGEHRVLQIMGKGGKERTVPLHLEAVERLTEWLSVVVSGDDRMCPLFPATASPRGRGVDGFQRKCLTTRSVEHLIRRYTKQVDLDPAVTVHSLRVTALTTARERGADIVDLQDFAGHADPRTTLTYIRSRDRLSKSPAYVLHY